MKHKKEVSVSLVQAAPVLGDKAANLTTIEEYAEKEKVDLLIFPELFLTGYLCRDELPRLAIHMDGQEITKLEKIASKSGSHIVVGAPTLGEKGELYNSALLIGPEGYVGRFDKYFLVNFLPFEEKIHFHAGKRLPVFDTPLGRIGLIICYDIFFPELSTALAMQGADIMICISASPTLSRIFFETVIPARAIENTVFLLYNNLIGTEERLTFWGGARVISPKGFELVKGEYFKEQSVRAILDMREIPVARAGRPVLRDKRPDLFEFLRSL